MALQASGEIKMSEINVELGQGPQDTISLDNAESGGYGAINTNSPSYPSDARPAAMSEWYSYNHTAAPPNVYYWDGDGVNDYLRDQAMGTLFAANASQDMSFTGWFKINETVNATQQLMSFSTSTPSGTNQIFIQYLDTEVFTLRYRNNGAFHQKQVRTSSSGTGMTGSWRANNRGNVNSDGFVMLTFTYDASNRTASSGIKIYWNATEMTSVASSTNVASPVSYNVGSMAIGDLVSSSPYNANVFNGGIDEVKIYNKVLSAAEVTSLYNSGQPASASAVGVTSGLLHQFRMENNANDTETAISLGNTGTFNTY